MTPESKRINQNEAKKEAEIYIHIPFCVRKCAYCDFLSYPADEKTKEQYINALLHEIAASSHELRNHIVRSVFIGGGTPGILKAGQITRILEMLYRCFSIRKNAEITIECNPGTADSDKFRQYLKSGVNRLSIGAQSFDDDLLHTIGRIHSASDIRKCFDDARSAGFDNINLDLIFALPGQDLLGWQNTLSSAAELSPDHISAYSLILEENTPLSDHRNEYSFPDEETEREMYYDTARILAGYGYKQYEISNYAKPDRACIHNIGYWTGVEYKGFGLGASSYLGESRFKNTDQMEEYLKFCEEPEKQYKEIQKLTMQNLCSEFMILGLRMTDGVSVTAFQNRFGREIEEVFPGVIEKYLALGFLIQDNDRIALSSEGVSVSNSILCEFV